MVFASRTNALATLAKSHPAACLPSSRCPSRPPRGQPLGPPERCNSLTKRLSNNQRIIYDWYIATQEPAPENPGVTSTVQCTFYNTYALDTLLPPGPHLHTPDPLSTPERGLCRGPPPHPGREPTGSTDSASYLPCLNIICQCTMSFYLQFIIAHCLPVINGTPKNLQHSEKFLQAAMLKNFSKPL